MRLIFFLGVPDATKPEVTLYPVHIGRFGARTVAARVHGLADLVEQFCFTYRHSLHTHRIERVSCDCSIWVNAFDAISRIASRAAFSGLSVESITSIPAVEVCQPICAICAPRDEVRAFSCSYERIKQRQPCLAENTAPTRLRPPPALCPSPTPTNSTHFRQAKCGQWQSMANDVGISNRAE